MYYLHLKFDSASLVYFDKKKTDIDLANPIGVNQISNMLHVMMGFPPVPSKRLSLFSKNEAIYDIALNHSYIKYDGVVSFENKSGKLTYLPTLFHANKGNCHSTRKVVNIIGGNEVQGILNWENFIFQFFRDGTRFSGTKYKTRQWDSERYERVIGLFNKVLNCDDVTKTYPDFFDFLNVFGKHLNDEEVVRFKKEFGDDLSAKKTSVLHSYGWYDIIFNGNIDPKKTGGNSTYKTERPVLNVNGIKYKLTYSGEMIIEIEDEKIIEQLKENGHLPTILDGGVISVISLKKLPPYFDFKENFAKISA